MLHSPSWLIGSGEKGFSPRYFPSVYPPFPKDSPIQLPTWHCLAQHWLCQPVWAMSFSSTSLSLLSFIHSTFIFYLSFYSLCDVVTVCQPAAGAYLFVFLLCIVVCLCMCLSAVCWDGVSGWLKRWFIGTRCRRNSLITPQIASSQTSSRHSTTVSC